MKIFIYIEIETLIKLCTQLDIEPVCLTTLYIHCLKNVKLKLYILYKILHFHCIIYITKSKNKNIYVGLNEKSKILYVKQCTVCPARVWPHLTSFYRYMHCYILF